MIYCFTALELIQLEASIWCFDAADVGTLVHVGGFAYRILSVHLHPVDWGSQYILCDVPGCDFYA